MLSVEWHLDDILNSMRRRSESKFPYRTQVLERAFTILDVLASSGKDQSLAEMTERAGVNRSTCYRLLRILERHHFTDRDPVTGKYRLGSKLLELGKQSASRFDLAQLARPYLEWLSQESGETAHLGILCDGEVVSIANVDSHHALRISGTLGLRSPAHCSSLGKALLAFLPEADVNELVRRQGLKPYTRNTITTRAGLKRELQQIRRRGYAIDDEELEEGLKCIGAPVRDSSGRAIAALSIAGAAFRLNGERLPLLAQSVVRAAADLSSKLGFRA